MKLTGKCLIEFNKWLLDFLKRDKEKLSITNKLNALSFNTKIDSMKYGVYQDYFGSIGIRIFISDNLGSQNWELSHEDRVRKSRFGFQVDYENYGSFKYKTMPEARTAAIQKANDLRNEQLNS